MCDCNNAYFTRGVVNRMACVMCDYTYRVITFHTWGVSHA